MKKFYEPKAVIGSFTTHDEMSPILINGKQLSEMIMWLNATLPVNSYFVDGFDTGDNYIYMWANKEAFKTFTDDDYYFVHRGKLDIFNFSRQAGGKDDDLLSNFVLTNHVKRQLSKLINNGKLTVLKTSEPSVFAYAISYNGQSVIVIGNLNFRNSINTTVSIPHIGPSNNIVPFKITNPPITQKGSFKVQLDAGEIQVLYVTDLEVK